MIISNKPKIQRKPRVKTPQEKINDLKVKLTKTDYLSHKHSDKALTDEEYEPMRIQRQQWRDEINELEATIK